MDISDFFFHKSYYYSYLKMIKYQMKNPQYTATLQEYIKECDFMAWRINNNYRRSADPKYEFNYFQWNIVGTR